MNPAPLMCRAVSVHHDGETNPVIEGLSFTVEPGERVAVVGLNGAGKTSLLLALVGLVPHSGEIVVCGLRLSRRTAPELRRNVGFLFNVPEDQVLFPTVEEDVAFGLVRGGLGLGEARQRAHGCLHALGIGHLADQLIHRISHGQKLRVALASAIVTDPPLLLLDEPTAGLDPRGRRDLSVVLERQTAAQLIATHDLDFVDRTCTRVLLLEGGALAGETVDTAAIRARWGCDQG